MLSLSDDNQTEIIEAFNFTARYLDNLMNIENDSMVSSVYPSEPPKIKPTSQIPRLYFWNYINLY